MPVITCKNHFLKTDCRIPEDRNPVIFFFYILYPLEQIIIYRIVLNKISWSDVF